MALLPSAEYLPPSNKSQFDLCAMLHPYIPLLRQTQKWDVRMEHSQDWQSPNLGRLARTMIPESVAVSH